MLAHATELTQQMLLLAALVALPALAVAAVIGLFTGLFASATHVQDPALSFVPKLVGVVAVILALGSWGGGTVLRFTTALWRAIPDLVR